MSPRPGHAISLDPFERGAALLEPAVVVLRIRGADATDFLQRMVSADLRPLGRDQGTLATVLTGKGRLVAAFELYPWADGWAAVVEESAAPALASHLERAIILEVVSLEPAAGLAVLSLQGPAAAGILAKVLGEAAVLRAGGASAAGDDVSRDSAPGAPLVCGPLDPEAPRGEGADPGAGFLAVRPRCQAGGWDLVGPAEGLRGGGEKTLAGRLQAAGAVPVAAEVAEAARIAAGIPRFGIDATVENLPPEVGYDRALSYDKGCYAGQEVVARIRTYGHVNRRLCRLSWDDDGAATLPPAGTPVEASGREVGHLTSRARIHPGAVALALLRREVIADADAGATVTVAGRPARIGPLHPLYEPAR